MNAYKYLLCLLMLISYSVVASEQTRNGAFEIRKQVVQALAEEQLRKYERFDTWIGYVVGVRNMMIYGTAILGNAAFMAYDDTPQSWQDAWSQYKFPVIMFGAACLMSCYVRNLICLHKYHYECHYEPSMRDIVSSLDEQEQHEIIDAIREKYKGNEGMMRQSNWLHQVCCKNQEKKLC